jgi:tetratricopeptide (TPR) repeat protein
MSTSLCANIENIKGTYTILNDNYKDFSLVYGTIAAESGYLMRLYDYGTLGKDIAQAPAVVKLARTFFHRDPGQTGLGDFVLTVEIRIANDDDKQAIINGIAWTLAKITQLRKLPQHHPGLGELHAKIKKLSIRKGELSSYMNSLKQLSHRAPVEDIVRCIQDTEDNDLKLFKLLWTAYQEESSPDPIFPPGSTNAVILGIVYKIAGDHKEWIKGFYQKLNEQMGNKNETIFANQKLADSQEPSWQSWVEERFDMTNTEQLSQLWKTVEQCNPRNLSELRSNFEQIVYLALIPDRFPPVVSYTTAHYTYQPYITVPGAAPAVTETIGTRVHFPDCMETTLRNLTNFILYDAKTRTFKIPNDLNPIGELKSFYNTYVSTAHINNTQAHDAWTQVVENIPGASYAKELSERSIRYELNPSIANVMVILNHIFGLNLFADEQGNDPEEKLKNALTRVGKDFIKTYFPKLCNRLNLQLYGFFDPDGSKITLDEIDHKDSTGVKVRTKLSIVGRNTDIEIKTSPSHGEFEFFGGSEQSTPIVRWLSNNLATLMKLSNARRAMEPITLCYLTLYKQPDFSKTYLQNMPTNLHLNSFFYLPIENADYVYNKLLNTPASPLQQRRTPLSKHIFTLCFYLCSKVPDADQRTTCILQAYTIFIKSHNYQQEHQQEYRTALQLATDTIQTKHANGSLALFEAILEKEQGYQEASMAASQALQAHKVYESSTLFKLLFKKQQAYDQALAAASRALENGNFDEALELFGILVEQGQAYEQALEAVRVAYEHNKIYEILKILRLLVERDHGYDQALAAVQYILANQRYINSDVLAMVQALVRKEHGYQEAIEVASRAIKSEEQSGALDLFKALVGKGQAYDRAIEALRYALNNKQDFDASIPGLAWALVEKGQGYQDAIKMVETAEKMLAGSRTTPEQSQGLWLYIVNTLDLLESLVNQGKGYKEAQRAARVIMHCPYIRDESLQKRAHELAKLIEKKLQAP